METRVLVVLNPCAGQKAANRNLFDIIKILSDAGWQCTVMLTKQRGDGRAYVSQYGRAFDRIVCIGGDGTFKEVVSGVLDAGLTVPVGYIPSGSTNDFANSLKLSRNLLQATHDIATDHRRSIDVGSFNDRPFTYVASCGAFTAASYSADQSLKNTLGHLAYVLRGIQDLSDIKPHHLRLQTEDRVFEGDYIFGAFCNSTSLGGLLKLNPLAVDMNDGKLEVLLVEAPKTARNLARVATALLRQDYADCPHITFFSADRVTVDAPADMPWSLDGEYEAGSAHITVRNLRSAISLMAPPEQA